MNCRTVERDQIPADRQASGQNRRHIESELPSDGFDQPTGQWPSGHRSDGSTDQGRCELALLGWRRPHRHQIVQRWIQTALKSNDGNLLKLFSCDGYRKKKLCCFKPKRIQSKTALRTKSKTRTAPTQASERSTQRTAQRGK